MCLIFGKLIFLIVTIDKTSEEKLKADGLEETVITNSFVPFTQISAHVWD